MFYPNTAISDTTTVFGGTKKNAKFLPNSREVLNWPRIRQTRALNISRIFRDKEWPWHFAFWLTFLAIRVFIIRLYPGPFAYRLGIELLELPLKMLALYFAIYFLIRKLLLEKKYLVFSFAFVAYMLFFMLANRVEDFYLIYPLTKSHYTLYEAGFWNLRAAFFNLIYLYPVAGLGMAVYFIKNWYEKRIEAERLAGEKTALELKILKDQIHPHFLFNTLNNIYSLSLDQSPKAPEMMLRLSQLLSYMLYETNSRYVPLAKEIEALKNYTELEKIRFDERLQITFDTAGEINGQLIAPLLLFPLLENSFKHATGNTLDGVWISFHLYVAGNMLELQLENSLPHAPNPQPNGGIGLQNLKKQLNHLYPARHELNIAQQDTFLINLKLNLDAANLRNN